MYKMQCDFVDERGAHLAMRVLEEPKVVALEIRQKGDKGIIGIVLTVSECKQLANAIKGKRGEVRLHPVSCSPLSLDVYDGNGLGVDHHLLFEMDKQVRACIVKILDSL